MPRLKTDLHVHTADDPWDRITYSAEMLIDAAAQLNIDVLAIACHCRVMYTERIAEYARRRGVLLMPAIELCVEGKHIVVLNPDTEQAGAATYAELRALGRRAAFLVAPHPFYPERACLHGKLIEHIDLFDAIEYASLHLPGINFNRKAAAVAKRFGLPMLGTSDTHGLPYCDSTFSWVESEEATVPSVIEALRAGRITIQTRSRPWRHVRQMLLFYVKDQLRLLVGQCSRRR
jgi:predicted metal-dependent phosphoesterase TrpH